MTYKIVFLDVDGTITHHEDGTIPESTIEAVKELKNKGLKVVAATGRPLSMCSELEELGIDTFITANGGYAKHQHEVIHSVPMAKEIVKEVMEFAKLEKNGLSFYTEGFTMNGVAEEKISTALQETLSLYEYPETNSAIHEEDVFLLCLFADDEKVEKYIKRFPHLTFRRWHPYVLNVLQEDVSKSRAILKTLEYFGFHQSEAIAFGDGENDIDMLELAGLGIAMGNGSEKLKAAADFVTKPSGEDGIEFALRKFGVI
ncbi:HAD family hydrolase [[Bacillus] enclensis]|uniref:Cof subfamily of IIB subfamily of haloacid dehalogenase superfamily/HAD-superfamily hydrolase, subfamily IIB n=2 Tax=Rossellomorea TaxID=2837508 RepID=A0A0V8HKE7_9BACI|nr:Cof-type HAD-IIB family hydrolase [[Bacillus] enclensis]KSU63123.1 HAD family hydrolase [[Bacillus] enclensis]SCB78707.1 Cof subfamily of IIB subfamily of haloacid dehalogenase superfamily/HAD-superfamily hydrolase, subfamily IIB [[Bacillus] enclensis]